MDIEEEFADYLRSVYSHTTLTKGQTKELELAFLAGVVIGLKETTTRTEVMLALKRRLKELGIVIGA